MADLSSDKGKAPVVGPGETARGWLQKALIPGLVSIIGLILVGWLTFITVSFNSRFDDLKQDLLRDLDGYGTRIQHLERLRMGAAPNPN